MSVIDMMAIQFLGATGTVTGSKYLVHVAGKQVLVDCGLFQGYKQLRLRNRGRFPIDPKSIDAVVLTHAHLDHSGYLPLLVKDGYKGRVFCTAATADLCGILLPDSGHLQEEDARYANHRGFSKHHPALPLYTREDAERCLPQLDSVEFDRSVKVAPNIDVRLLLAGHILGAAMVEICSAGRILLFTGDLGRPNDLVMKPPVRVEHADYLVTESTYGNRRHDVKDPLEVLADVITRTAARQGVVIIPAFAVGRAQTLLYAIHLLKSARRIPDVPVFLNSPMATDATNIYHRHRAEHRLTEEQCKAMCTVAKFVNSAEESKALNNRRGPMILISASGMVTGGRVLHHLKAFAPDPRNTILLSGFQSGGTRGAAIADGAKTVKIHGEFIPIRAEVATLSNLSAHADYAETLDWLGHFSRPPRQTYITHGEPAAADALRGSIEEKLKWRCYVPEHLERASLD
jgi:metallo-beta-lactamase family protein